MITLAEEAAKRGGDVLRENFGRASLQVTEKTASDFVTEVDLQAEEAIRSFLASEAPDHATLMEESGRSEQRSDFEWVVDPLDGTTNYIHRYPFFSVSVALRHKGEVIAGAVYDPMRREMFTAEKGEPTRLNGVPIDVARTEGLDRALVCTGFPLRIKDWLDLYLESFREIVLGSAGVRRDGSAALDLAYVAAGRFDAFWELGLKPWDTAAGALLVTQAGGEVTDFHGGPDAVDGGDILASNRRIHPEVLAILARVFAAGRPTCG
jgi:myo-inositol-1(or 4)-monophosphatase